jgi:hypothetical protein
VVFVPGALLARLTTGAIEGTVRGLDGRPVAGSAIVVTGGAGLRTVIHSNSSGEFSMTRAQSLLQLPPSVAQAKLL